VFQGISLNVEQYQAFLKAIPEINASLKELGVDVTGGGGEIDEDEEVKPRKKAAVKKESKANIDATSDEEE
jgi:hypothetical protein